MKIPINLNEVIKVRLTDHGKDIYYHRFDHLNNAYNRLMCKPEYPYVDEDGYASFQLWVFMELYGPHMGMTSLPVIENNTVIYDVQEDEQDDGELDFVQNHEKIPVELKVSKQPEIIHRINDAKIKVIDSDKLINAINEGSYDVNLSAVMALGTVMSDTFPVSDAEPERKTQPEIIRCKDCKHLQKWRSEESAKKFGQIYECAKGVLMCPVPEDFCSHAERRFECLKNMINT